MGHKIEALLVALILDKLEHKRDKVQFSSLVSGGDRH
jgi:hypothetical protein